MAGDICPLLSQNNALTPCIKKQCRWWSHGAPKDDCVVNQISRSVDFYLDPMLTALSDISEGTKE